MMSNPVGMTSTQLFLRPNIGSGQDEIHRCTDAIYSHTIEKGTKHSTFLRDSRMHTKTECIQTHSRFSAEQFPVSLIIRASTFLRDSRTYPKTTPLQNKEQFSVSPVLREESSFSPTRECIHECFSHFISITLRAVDWRTLH